MSVSGSFVQLPQGKNCTEPTELLGERGVAEICWFLVAGADAKEAQEPVWGCHAWEIVGHNTSHVEVPTSSVFCIAPPW